MYGIYFYRKLGTILYMPFQFWYLKCQFRHFKKASTILIGSGNIMVFLMYQADKSQKIFALDTAEFEGPRYEGFQGFSRVPRLCLARLTPLVRHFRSLLLLTSPTYSPFSTLFSLLVHRSCWSPCIHEPLLFSNQCSGL